MTEPGFIERRDDLSRWESKRVEDKVYALIIELVDRVSAMEATQRELVKTIDKYNNVTGRVRSLEEYREQCVEKATHRRFPTMAVLGSVIGAVVMAIVNKFFFQ